MKATLKYYLEVDTYAEKEFYYGEILVDNKVIYSHVNALKSYAHKSDMVKHLHIKCAELGLIIEDVIDDTYVPSMWEEEL